MPYSDLLLSVSVSDCSSEFAADDLVITTMTAAFGLEVVNCIAGKFARKTF